MMISSSELWLDYIEIEIEKKYGIKDPIFIIHKKALTKDEIVNWMDHIQSPDHLTKYKYLEENRFELKGFFPNPSDKICYEFIEDFLQVLDNSQFFKLGEKPQNLVFYKRGKSLYNKKQIQKELFFQLKTGSTDLSSVREFIEDPVGKGRFIAPIDAMDNELYHRINDGFVTLEYKD